MQITVRSDGKFQEKLQHKLDKELPGLEVYYVIKQSIVGDAVTIMVIHSPEIILSIIKIICCLWEIKKEKSKKDKIKIELKKGKAKLKIQTEGTNEDLLKIFKELRGIFNKSNRQSKK